MPQAGAVPAGMSWHGNADNQTSLFELSSRSEVIVFIVALIHSEGTIVDNRVALEAWDLPDGWNLGPFGDLLFVEHLFGQPDHRIPCFAWIPEERILHRTIFEILRCLVGGCRSNAGDFILQMLIPYSLSRSRRSLAAETEESLYIRVGAKDFQGFLARRVLILRHRETIRIQSQFRILLLCQFDRSVCPDVVRRYGERPDVNHVFTLRAHELHHLFEAKLTKLFVIDHFNVKVGALLVGRLVRNHNDALLFSLSQDRFKGLRIVRDDKQRVDPAADGILDQANLLRFVG